MVSFIHVSQTSLKRLMNQPDGNIHVIPKSGNLKHIESSKCWCEPTLIQDIDDEHDKQVWTHKGYEELNN